MKKEALCLVAAAFLLGGCFVAPDDVSPACQGERCGDPGDDDDDVSASPQPVDVSPEEIAGVANLLHTKCTACHGRGQALGDLADVLDVDELKRRNLIGATADTSALFQVVTSAHQAGKNDPLTGRLVVLPTEREIAFVRTWLDAGAPNLRGDRQPLDLGAYADLLRADASASPDANDLVYVDFHAAYNNNGRFGDAALSALANATIKALHQLDVRSFTRAKPGLKVVLDANGLPVAVRFRASEFNLDKPRDVVGTLARLANRHDPAAPFDCAVPTIPVLDFLHVASSDDVFNPLANDGQGAFESGYSNIALRRLLVDAGRLAEEQLVFESIATSTFVANGFTNVSAGVDLYDALAAVDPVNFDRQALDTLYNVAPDPARLARGCVVTSATSANQRCVDRLERAAPTDGAAYLSFDASVEGDVVVTDKDYLERGFFGPAGPANDPLVREVGGLRPFSSQGGEGFFRQANAMPGFFSFNADFKLVSNAANYAVAESPPGAPLSSSSAACGSCHETFAVPFQDVVMPTLLGPREFSDPSWPAFAANAAQSQEAWNAAFAADAEGYAGALREVYYAKTLGGPLHDGVFVLGSQYRDALSADAVAAELGAPSVEALSALLDALAQASPDAVRPDRSVSRDDFTRNYERLVSSVTWGGEDFLRGCVARSAGAPVEPAP